MSKPRQGRVSRLESAGGLAHLRRRLADAEETVRAIRAGEVDAVVGVGKGLDQVFTLEGAEHAYRVLIESMNEGALTLTTDKMILYANQCFARLVKCPLQQVIGGSLRRFLSLEDRALLRPFMRRAAKSGGKIEVLLRATDGTTVPAHLSIRPLAASATKGATFGLVVTDMTEARRTEDLLRALAHRVVQVQEAERSSVALELHDNITQLLCGLLFRSEALVDKLTGRGGPARREAVKLRTLLGQAAAEVERISRDLRPSILDQLGLFAVLQAACSDFMSRTGVATKLIRAASLAPLPAEADLALYRILQEALRNIEQHARARHVTVSLRQAAGFVQLVINDDGVGFDALHHAARRKGKGVLGLVGMRERAAYVGGTLTVKSGPRAGTEIDVRVPLPPASTAADRSAA
ncbi:MAG: histidine kinase [Lacunisphaera sp.]|nr:histidine kinase [Lacunisphaera sp.]